MARTLLVLVLLVSIGSSAAAQALPVDRLVPALPTEGERKAADVVSWITAGAAVAVDTWAAWHDENRGRALLLEGARLGIFYSAAFGVKTLVHRERPCAPTCGIDNPNFSFWSAHTGVACQSIGGGHVGISVTLSVLTALGRVEAGKHWLTDTLAGCGAGLLTSRIR